MTNRDQDLQYFIDACFAAFDQTVSDPEGRRSIAEIFRLLALLGEQREGGGTRMPACVHLHNALHVSPATESLRRTLDAFRAIEPKITWRRREDTTGTASENFNDGHANGMIIGPGGIELRSDVWLGVTLMAPKTRYPDHTHAPEETYLVMSEGEFQHGESSWFSPGVGGTFYNPPGIWHAMRSVEKPLLAFWALRPCTGRANSTD
ncbi:dimethylsulfoniopropionate lyase [Rhizobium cauense]|uniref:dimethylsulfoniopropionate lyase n=1 Tax=Rhizobium cauense TaxID=1166683 RepID=UPI001C6EB9DD|nr:dimethylsulfoniopropionate lyase [Rhizobium cauense]MBW9118159.1 dimethylsulfoniopropionate lyase [Rhizobium cauense]